MTSRRQDIPYFTLFVPSYNRAESLDKTLKSVEAASHLDLEVIIIDDGSEDNTRQIADQWCARAPFDVVYVHQENRGKAAAHNAALEHAHGHLFMTLDAGDLLLPEGLAMIKDRWETIRTGNRQDIAGIGALCLHENGALAGVRYPEQGKVANYLEMLRYTGEKRQAILTSIMKEYPYPIIQGEKHIRLDLILKRMAHRYKLLFLNIPVQINIREKDGITANIRRYRMENPGGFRLYYLEEITLHKEYYGLGKRFGDHWRYIRFSMHAGIGLTSQAKEVQDPILWLTALPRGLLKWWTDRFRRVRSNRTRRIHGKT